MSETCSTCKFNGGFYAPPDQDIQVFKDHIKCRRNAPVATGGMMSPSLTLWAFPHKDDWCGEHQPKEPPHG